MLKTDAQLPSNRQIRIALRKTTDRLADEITAPQRQAPSWTDFEWRAAMAASVIHGLSGLLHGRLRWQGPPVWQAFLADQMRQGLLRQQRIAALLARLDEAGRAQDVAMLAMKGSALLALGLYAPGERPMSDIDLLVHPRDRDRALQILQDLGYVTELDVARHVCLRPADGPSARTFGEHADNPVKIELHCRVYEALPIREVDITAQVLQAPARGGIVTYPSKAALLRHLLLHAAGNIRSGSLRFIQVHDIARLAARLDAQDWHELTRQDASPEGLWWALPPLELASRHFPGAIPAALLREVERSSRPLLRWTSRRQGVVDASFSSGRLRALPGLAWSASMAEAGALFGARMFPGREARAKRRELNTNLAYVQSSWIHASQAMRILHWAWRRPVAHAAMYSIRQALAYRPVEAAWSSSNRAAV